LSLRPAIFNGHILALDITDFAQALAERTQTACVQVRRIAAEKPDHRHRRLLGARGERPCGRPAEKGDELAPPHASSLRADANIFNF